MLNPHQTKTAPFTATFSEPLDTDYLESSYQTACALLAAGYSVFPLRGDTDPNNPKAPAIAWGEYQRRLATPAEAKEWFINRGFGGLAIVCGRISNLYVIDPDTAEANAAFETAFPNLLDTHTTLSAGRQLPHRRYRLPAGESISFTGRAGVIEWRGEGHYIVCAPTQIAGNIYTVVQGGQPLELTTDQLRRLKTWFAGIAGTDTEMELSAPFELVEPGNSGILIAQFAQRVLTTGSRGKAHFMTAMLARDSGWSLSAARAAYKKAFIEYPPVTDHPTQTPQQRGREFDSILTSVYKRKPGRKNSTSGIPTLLREHLLSCKATALVRVLDCFVMHGIQPGQRFTEAQAVSIGSLYSLSRKAIRTALQATTAEIQQGDFARPPSTATTQNSGAALADLTPLFSSENNFVPKCHSNSNEYQQYSIVSVTNGNKIQRGRKSKYFAMPDVLQIAAVLGITDTKSDAIPFEALAEITDYRAALTRALLARRPGQYSNQLLAKRVGVNRRTVQRSIKRDKSIKSEPRESGQQVTADTVETLIADDRTAMNGHWLEVEGKKYPPTREVATTYLQRGQVVTLVKREANHYSVKAAIVIQDTPITEPLAVAVGAENDYSQPSAITSQETVITADPLLIELTSLGGVLVPIEPSKTHRRPPENKAGGTS